jgi:hypothetical protein
MRREIKSVDAPIITNDPSIEDGLEFKSGNIYQVQAPVDQFKELGISGTGASTWNWINFLRGSLAKSGQGGVGPIAQGAQPRAATDIAQEAQEKEVSAGLYYMFYQDLLEQKAWITIKNMIQFYTAAKTEMVLGTRKFKKILSIAEQTLWGGGVGSHEIRITDHPASAKELKKESYLRSIFKKERVDIIETTPDALRKVDFDLKINFEPEQSPAEERVQYLDFITTIMNLFGNVQGLLSPKKIFYRLLEKNNEPIGDFVDPSVESDYENDRFGIKPKTQPPSPQDRVNAALQGGGQGQPPQQGQPQGGTPQPNQIPALNGANQGMRGMAYGAQGPRARMRKGGQILKKFCIFLHCFKKETIFREYMRREFPRPSDYVESRQVWQGAFYRTPELADYLKHREIEILRSIPQTKNSNDFLLGQIAENRLYAHYDVPNRAEPRKVEMDDPLKKVVPKKTFFEKLGYADKGKEEEGNVEEGSVRGSEEQPA